MEMYMNRKGQVLGWIVLFVFMILVTGILWVSYGRTVTQIDQSNMSVSENSTVDGVRTGLLTLFDMSSMVFWIIAAMIIIAAVLIMLKS